MSTGRQPEGRYLRAYFGDHLAVLDGVAALLERIMAAERWSEDRGAFTALAADIGRDREAAEEIARQRGVTINPVKRLLARAGERGGRLKGNGRMVRSSPLSRLVELEGLRLGLTSCMSFWETLEALDIARERAAESLARLREHDAALTALHGRLARSAFVD